MLFATKNLFEASVLALGLNTHEGFINIKLIFSFSPVEVVIVDIRTNMNAASSSVLLLISRMIKQGGIKPRINKILKKFFGEHQTDFSNVTEGFHAINNLLS